MKRDKIALISLLSIIPVMVFNPLIIKNKQMPLIETTEGIEIDFKQELDLRNIISKQVVVSKEVEIGKVIETKVVEVEEVVEIKLPHYNPYNLREKSNLSQDQIHIMLEGNALQSLSAAYVWAEEVYGVNLLFLISINILESGNGRSSLAISNNNLSGITDGYGGFVYYDNWGESLYHTAELLSTDYLSEDGLYFNGYGSDEVNIKYCELDNWDSKIDAIAYELMSKL